MWSIGRKGLIVLSFHTVDRYLLGIALLSIWLSIMRNLKQLDIDSKYLLHFGLDGPVVNLSFEHKLT